MSSIKNDLSGLKSKLERIEGEFEDKLKEVESKDAKFKRIDEQIEELMSKKDSLIKLNIGGKIFQTKLSTLLSVKDTLLAKIILSYEESKESFTELFFDRSFDQFDIILDFLRTKSFDPNGMTKAEIDDLKIEVEYYGISEIDDVLTDLQKEVEFVSFEGSPRYSTAGTHNVKDLKDKSLMKGICVESPYDITINLNFEHEFDKIEIGGWNGNTSLWSPANGANSKILTSKDKKTWVEVGTIPSNYGAQIQTVSLKKSSAKHIKFQHNGYLGIGYLNIIRIGRMKNLNK